MADDGYIIFLAGNTMAMPSVKELVKSGKKVCVVDRNPCDEAYKEATCVRCADISKFEEVSEAVRDLKVCAVIPVNDFGIITSSKLAEEHKVLGWTEAAARMLSDKHSMKEAWINDELPTPFSVSVPIEEILSGKFIWVYFPSVVKPSFSGGASRGVFKVTSKKEIIEAVTASRQYYLNNMVIIEEFVQGTEHTVEVLINDGETKVISISDKLNYEWSDTVVQKLYFPGPVGNLHRSAIEALMPAACRSLGLSFGCAHFEILINSAGIHLLEVGGRPGGGLNFHPIGELANGFNYPCEVASILMGNGFLLKKNKKVWQLGWFFWEGRDAVFEQVTTDENFLSDPNLVAFEVFWKKGQLVKKRFLNDMERPGYILVKGESREQVDALMAKLQKKVHFDYASQP